MSYFNTLNSFQDSASAIQSHAQDVANESASAGKNTVDQQFSHVSDILGKVGGDLGSFGGAFHVSRRVYKKFQSGKKAVQDAKNKLEDAKNNPQKQPDESNQQDNETKDTPENETNDTHTPNGAEDDSSATPASTDEAQARTTTDATEAEPPTASAEPATVSAEPSTEGPQSNFFKQNPDIYENLKANPELVEGVGERQALGTLGQNTAPEGGTTELSAPNPNDPSPSGGQRIQNTANPEPEPTTENPTSAPQTVAEASESSSGDIEAGAKAFSDIKPTPTGGLGGTGLGAGESDLLDVGEQFGKSTLSSISSTVSELGTVSGVLDAVGPIGEVLGAGVGIADLFYGLFSKSKENSEEEEAENSAKDAITQTGGIDVKNVIHSGSIGGSVGTMV